MVKQLVKTLKEQEIHRAHIKDAFTMEKSVGYHLGQMIKLNVTDKRIH